jgi:peptide/nickel transport system substrate-binding protein
MRLRSSVRAAAVPAVLALLLAGCGGSDKSAEGDETDTESSAAPASGEEEGADDGDEAEVEELDPADARIDFAIDDEAEGPAPEIEGAEEGGTLKVLTLDDPPHLDPARIFVSNLQNLSNLMTRTLTGYRQVGEKVTLVGDLATNTGVTKDKGKTWEFELRDGVTWEDGSPVTAQDVKYGIERSFADIYTEGPTYLQEWLVDDVDFRKKYKGPYGGKHLDAISTPDKKTLVLKFKKAQPDLPFAVALSSAAPVKESKDTKGKYDDDPFSSGPYKVTEHKADKTLVLEKNEEWEADSDPIRYQLLDSYEFEFGMQPLEQNQRLIEADGDDATAICEYCSVSPEVLDEVLGTPELEERTSGGFTSIVTQYNINNDRISDLEVRKALLYALPREAMRQVQGGEIAGAYASTVMSPTLIGYEPYDLWDADPAGDPEKAKGILEDAGKVGQKIVYAYVDTARGQEISVVVADALEEAGFEVVKKAVNSQRYNDEVGRVDNGFDLYSSGWGADWPSGSTVFPPTLDGRRVRDGSPNLTHFDDKEINAEIDRILKITDIEEAGAEWAKLDKKVMEKIPYIPYLYQRVLHLRGEKVGGVNESLVYGLVNLNGLYLTGN